MAAVIDNSFSLYLHIPYCVKKCPYCDFNSYDTPATESIEGAYTEALLAELEHRAQEPDWRGRALATVFFGGGTPSLFSPGSIGEILGAAAAHFPFAGDIEVTLEANPGTVAEQLGKDKLAGFRAAGVNRISTGGQSFNAKKLAALGRIHSTEDTAAAVENIKRAGFANFNIDLMFGIAGETAADWEADLAGALAHDPPHLSAYGLTIEPGTEFGRLARRGVKLLPGEELQAEFYTRTQEILAAAGYEQYEISNYARAGHQCRHNLRYWRGRDFLGLGAGAHSGINLLGSQSREAASGSPFGRRWSNIPKPEHYIARARSGGDAAQRREEVNPEQAELEFFMLGLRTSTGIDTGSYERIFAQSFAPRYRAAVERLQQEGLLAQQGTSIVLTSKGFLFSDHVLSTFAQSSS